MATRRTSDSRRTTAEISTAAAPPSVRSAATATAGSRPTRRQPDAAATSGAAATKSTVAVSVERRRGLIAEAAYLRAERRGFAPGQEVEDWLAAEQEIDRLLSGGASARQ